MLLRKNENFYFRMRKKKKVLNFITKLYEQKKEKKN